MEAVGLRAKDFRTITCTNQDESQSLQGHSGLPDPKGSQPEADTPAPQPGGQAEATQLEHIMEDTSHPDLQSALRQNIKWGSVGWGGEGVDQANAQL